MVAILFLLVVLFSINAIVDPDLPGHIAYGRDHIEQGELFEHDPYSYSVDEDATWINHEWVFEVLSAWVFATLGPTGLVLLQTFCWSVVGGLILWLVRRQSTDFVPTAVVYLFFAALVFAAITIRPQLFTYLLFAVLLTLLELARANRLWVAIPVGLLFLLWVNLHGGFLAGLGILGLYALGCGLDALLKRDAAGDLAEGPRRPWALFLCLSGSVVAGSALTFANPYGAGLHRFLLGSLGRSRPQISEWRSIELDSQGVIFLVFLALTAWALLKRERSRIPLAHVLVLGVTAFLGVRHVRHVPFFAMAAAVFATGAVADLYRGYVPSPDEDIEHTDLRRMRRFYALLLIPALALNLAWPNRDTLGLRLHPAGNSPFPTGAVRYMDDQQVSGNLLVHFDWAQLMIWKFYPRVKVFYDGRFRTVYSAELEEVFFAFHDADGDDWRRALDEYPTDMVLMPTTHPATARMQRLDDWRIAYHDTQAVLFVRKKPGEGKIDSVAGEHPPPSLPFRPEDAGQ